MRKGLCRARGIFGGGADGAGHLFQIRLDLVRQSEQVLPALGEGGKREGFEVVVVCMVATGTAGPDLDAAIETVRGQLAFYGSTPAYAPVLELEGHGDLHPRLNALSKQGRWDDMNALIPDDLLESIAVVGRREEIAGLVRERVAGITDTVSIECTRRPDPEHFADIVAALQ